MLELQEACREEEPQTSPDPLLQTLSLQEAHPGCKLR